MLDEFIYRNRIPLLDDRNMRRLLGTVDAGAGERLFGNNVRIAMFDPSTLRASATPMMDTIEVRHVELRVERIVMARGFLDLRVFVTDQPLTDFFDLDEMWFMNHRTPRGTIAFPTREQSAAWRKFMRDYRG